MEFSPKLHFHLTQGVTELVEKAVTLSQASKSRRARGKKSYYCNMKKHGLCHGKYLVPHRAYEPCTCVCHSVEEEQDESK